MAKVVTDSASDRVFKSGYTLRSRPIDGLAQDRVLPRQVSTGSSRGTQTIGYGNTKIDGSNNRISIAPPGSSASLALGDTNDTNDNFGLALTDNSGVLRLLGGTYPDGSVKVKLSQPGKDVSTADDSDLVWSSDFNLFKIVDILPVSLPVTLHPTEAIQASTATPHGLTYTPAYVAYITLDPAFASLSTVGVENGSNPFILNGTSGASIVTFGIFSVTVDSSNINFSATVGVVGSDTYTFSAKVYLLKETIV